MVGAFAQEPESNYRTKKIAVKDSVIIDSVSINPAKFIIKDKNGKLLDTTIYNIDFAKSLLTFKKTNVLDTVIVDYLRYPVFLTRVYQQLDESIIVNSTSGLQTLYKLEQRDGRTNFTPFDGLATSGSISRGVTIGNNQNSVLNSELDLQISGKLSEKVTLRASIQDANIPLQESGYSQRLDEFDQVFIELLSDDWRIRAGDIDLSNPNSYFARFTKRVQGLMVNANLNDNLSVFASGALVRGQFTTSQFSAQEGNQGPYKIRGPNDELFVLIVSGSETVYVNGVPLERGENRDYIIDYNAGELIFNSTFPITSEMRITIDYQISDRNYSRFTAFGGGMYKSEKLNFGVSVYSESDAKNQPLQQNLSTEQTQILADAGDDMDLMNAPSASEESYSENRILYRKEVVNGEEIFVFSTDPEDQLFSVKFTLVGPNQGNYVLSNSNAISNIYEYVAPVNDVPQGNYEPIIRLVAPERLQVAILNGSYLPNERTSVSFELAGSKNDLNLFSNLDDNNNDGLAAKLTINQKIIKSDSLWNLSAVGDIDFIQKDFRTIQRLYRAEFNRDWNLDNPLGNQILLTSGVRLAHSKKGQVVYNFEHLNYSENFNGNRHNLLANLRLNDLRIFSKSSYLRNTSSVSSSTFLRSFNRIVYSKENKWVGGKIALEDNEQRTIDNDSLTPLSQKFNSYETFVGIGDSTAVFTEIGFIKRLNDSLRNNSVVRVNTSNTYYLKSRLIQNKNSNLQLFVNYRNLKAEVENAGNEKSLNSRVNYNQRLFNNLVTLATSFETNSGTLPQQDFTYVEVEPGQGTYAWIDYNNNDIQELNEFEVAQFQDQGNYIRVLLPNQVFIRTHQKRLSQTITFNFQKLSSSDDKWNKLISHFYNQTSYLIDRKEQRDGNAFNINPFKSADDSELALNKSVRNVLFFNRGKQYFTTSYTFLTNTNRNLLSIGFQQNKLTSHQLNFNHKWKTNWLINSSASVGVNESESENFTNRNFKFDEVRLLPKISYLFNENTQFDIFYQYTTKENNLGGQESLTQNNYGCSFTLNSNQQSAITGEVNLFSNKFAGDANTPVAYQMLEGLQPGQNFTWSLLAQRKLTKFLDLNLNYFGRKTPTSKTIHTGTIQLKAYF